MFMKNIWNITRINKNFLEIRDAFILAMRCNEEPVDPADKEQLIKAWLRALQKLSMYKVSISFQ